MSANPSNDNFLKAIDVCQGIINRMAKNSFLIKGWTITLVVASLLLKGTQEQVFIAFIPLIMFWFLDTYFLKQEKLFRELYKSIIANKSNDRTILDMSTKDHKDTVSGAKTMFSRTLLGFYGTIFGLIVIYAILSEYSWSAIYDNIVRICENLINQI